MIVNSIDNHANKRNDIQPDKNLDIFIRLEKKSAQKIKCDHKPQTGKKVFKRHYGQFAGEAGNENPDKIKHYCISQGMAENSFIKFMCREELYEKQKHNAKHQWFRGDRNTNSQIKIFKID
jgi:hypothetical protein